MNLDLGKFQRNDVKVVAKVSFKYLFAHVLEHD